MDLSVSDDIDQVAAAGWRYEGKRIEDAGMTYDGKRRRSPSFRRARTPS
jgi:hypothetical protein